jgi:hypothetical protein
MTTNEKTICSDRILHNFPMPLLHTFGTVKLWNNEDRTEGQDIAKVYAPAGLEQQFQELYSDAASLPGANEMVTMLPHSPEREKGKEFLTLNQCLEAFHDELETMQRKKGLSYSKV